MRVLVVRALVVLVVLVVQVVRVVHVVLVLVRKLLVLMLLELVFVRRCQRRPERGDACATSKLDAACWRCRRQQLCRVHK